MASLIVLYPNRVMSNWLEVAMLLTPTRNRIKPSAPHLRCLREHIAVCKTRDKLLTVVISIVQTDGQPNRKERLVALHYLRIIFRLQVRICRGAISPICWIPNEVLGEILTYGLPANHHILPTATPLLPLRVCVLWREVALGTRSFWRSIAFWTPPSFSDRTCYPLRFLNDWLSCSGALPLDLFFERELTYVHLKLLVEVVLLAHCARCRHLDIHLTKDTAFALNNFVTLPPGSLQNLESLVLEGLDETDFALEGPGSWKPAITVFEDSPQLCKLTTNALEFIFSYQDDGSAHFQLTIIPLPKLTHLMITDAIRVDIFVIALAECVALQFLRVSLDLEDEIEDPTMVPWLPRNPVVLSNLTEFRISITSGLCFPALMSVFKFPALRHLHFQRIEGPHDLDSFSWRDSLPILRLRNIQILSLVGRVGTEEEILVLLENMPQVTQLSLDIRAKYQVLIPALFPAVNPAGGTPSGPLQLMTHLSLRLDGHNFPFPSQHLRDAIDSAQYSLTHLTVIMHRGYPRRLQEICDAFVCSSLKRKFGAPSGPLCKSTRLTTDQHLIAHIDTSLNYTMIDRAVVKYQVCDD